MFTPQKRLAILIALAIIALIGGLVVWAYQSSAYSASLTVEAAPKSSTITINGKGRKAGTYRVRPGEYTVKASRAGFADATKKVSITKGSDTYAGLVLSSNASSTSDWYKTHADDAKLAESISSQNAEADAARLEQTQPYIKFLPHIERTYRIDYGKKGAEGTLALYVTATDAAASQSAQDWLRKNGGDPEKLTIVYITNPLFNRLPYSTLSYSLTDGGFKLKADGTPFLTLSAKILLSRADGNEITATARYKNEINAYIRSVGVDPNLFVINYTVVPF